MAHPDLAGIACIRCFVYVMSLSAALGIALVLSVIGGLSFELDIMNEAFLIVSIQVLMASHAILFKTEKFYDLTGSITYVLTTAVSLYRAPSINGRMMLMAVCMWSWSLRLGTFLFSRIQRDGEDKRFRQAKSNGVIFMLFWIIQALWIFFNSLPMMLLSKRTYLPDRVTFCDHVAVIVWCGGFLMEAVADEQKRRFRLRRRSSSDFIATGLWKYSQHPNYFGEIMLWCGLAALAMQNMTLFDGCCAALAPVCTTFLLTCVSGIPTLDKQASKKWKGNEAYLKYKTTTSVLIPCLSCRASS